MHVRESWRIESKRGESILLEAMALMRARVVSVAGWRGEGESRDGGDSVMVQWEKEGGKRRDATWLCS